VQLGIGIPKTFSSFTRTLFKASPFFLILLSIIIERIPKPIFSNKHKKLNKKMSRINIFPFLITERNLALKIMPTANRKKTRLPKEAIKKIQR
ncbi:hypothetical protein ACQP7C_06370, partial [Acinetobacter baumannii]|uniref:hypothetical protein n=1 Tax=Acinetobacter baumannii TaxID=470 RepID=UPI003D09159F